MRATESVLVDVWKLARGAEAELEGPGLYWVVSGEPLLRQRGAEVIRLHSGDVVGVAEGRGVRVQARPDSAELMGARVEGEWAAAVWRGGGVDPTSLEPVGISRDGTDAARRAARLLRELAVPCPPEVGARRILRIARAVELLALCAELRPPEASARPPGSRHRAELHAALGQLRTAPLEGLSLAAFARELGLSERQVSRLFRRELGASFREHLIELRLERARQLLAETEQSVVDVAGETGWSSLAHFGAVFRRRTGLTPSAYRARARAAP